MVDHTTQKNEAKQARWTCKDHALAKAILDSKRTKNPKLKALKLQFWEQKSKFGVYSVYIGI